MKGRLKQEDRSAKSSERILLRLRVGSQSEMTLRRSLSEFVYIASQSTKMKIRDLPENFSQLTPANKMHSSFNWKLGTEGYFMSWQRATCDDSA